MTTHSYIESPTEYKGRGPSVFLAGGISGMPDWQAKVAPLLLPYADVLNPRRANFDLQDPLAPSRQIGWEFRHLAKADVVLFWFGEEAIQPIALFELGAYVYAGLHGKRVAVAAHPNYCRRQDVVMQLSLARPELVVLDGLDALVLATVRLLAEVPRD